MATEYLQTPMNWTPKPFAPKENYYWKYKKKYTIKYAMMQQQAKSTKYSCILKDPEGFYKYISNLMKPYFEEEKEPKCDENGQYLLDL